MTDARDGISGGTDARDSSGQAWHALPLTDVYQTLATTPEGLTAEQAARHKDSYGPNRLPQAKARHPLMRFLAQFQNLLMSVMVVAAVIVLAIGHVIDFLVILAVVLINAIVGAIQEGRAEQALDAIRRMIDPHASVMRDGRRITVAAEDVVPGDLLLLEAGDRVLADVRLVRARNLLIEEAVITGESVAVEKATEPAAAAAPLGDRSSIAFSGTLVAAGQGAGIVVATGADSELGRISTLIGEVETLKTPLIRQMDRFAQQLTAVILGISVGVFAFAVLARGYALADAFLVVISLAVSAIPEGLPAVMTIALAVGVQRMARRNAIIRKLPAVETLGSVSVICSDKTGTLTRNEMVVESVITAEASYRVSGVGYEPEGEITRAGQAADAAIDPARNPVLSRLAESAVLCNNAQLRQTADGWRPDGDPMEGALVALAGKALGDGTLGDGAAIRRDRPRCDELPFDPRYRYMATLHGDGDSTIGYVKGAPERILAMCAHQQTASGAEPLDQAYWEREIAALASRGQRVLALAVKDLPGVRSLVFDDFQHGVTMLGLVGLIDPPRPEAVAAIRQCQEAGITVKMITGDHAATAAAIARQLGLTDDLHVVEGNDLDRIDDDALVDLARDTAVFARTSPEHKLRLVKALQTGGAVIAMTGDGVNDAPALKRADVGVAMGGKGTEAAKEAAEIVLADDNFASIVAAVREGRTAHNNLSKVIAWTLPTNGGEALIVILALLLGLTLPMTPLQILWINMTTTVALGLTLAFEPTEAGVMRRPPRAPGASLLSRRLLWLIIFVSILFVLAAFGVFTWALARDLPLETARTMVVNMIVVLEIIYLFSIRYVYGTSLTWRGALGTPAVLIGVTVTIAVQFAFTYIPVMNRVFGTTPLALIDGLLIVIFGFLVLLAIELEKWIARSLLSVKERKMKGLSIKSA